MRRGGEKERRDGEGFWRAKHMQKRRQLRPWRGGWYVYDGIRREFLRGISTMERYKSATNPAGTYIRWAAGVYGAKVYKSPELAQKTASRINREVYHTDSAKWPCTPVTVVTGEAARRLDQINRR